MITINIEKLILEVGIKTSASKHLETFKKEDAPDGVYILTEKGNCIISGSWSNFKEKETAIGIAVIEGEHKLVVALSGSEEDIKLTEEYCISITGKQYINKDDAKKDWDGKENTRLFAEKGDSPAAKYCLDYEYGNIKKGSWWLPSFAEMNLMYRNKPMIDACLAICGGDILPGLWHWTSTELSAHSTWVLNWDNGSTDDNVRVNDLRVRPVSASLWLTKTC